MKSSLSTNTRDNIILKDMLNSARLVADFVAGADFETFAGNPEKTAAVLWQLTIIGETAKRISPETEKKIAGIEFHAIRGTRNRIVHGYDEIDYDVIWDITREHIPALIKELENYFSKIAD